MEICNQQPSESQNEGPAYPCCSCFQYEASRLLKGLKSHLTATQELHLRPVGPTSPSETLQQSNNYLHEHNSRMAYPFVGSDCRLSQG